MTLFLQLVNIPIEESLEADPLIASVFVVAAVMLAIVLAGGKRILLQRCMNFFVNRRRNNLFDVSTNIDWWMDMMMLFVLCVMASLCTMSAFGVVLSETVESWHVLLLFTLAFVAYFVFKFVIYRFVGWMFMDSDSTKRWLGDYATLLMCNSFVFFVVALLAIYFDFSILALQSTVLVVLILNKLLISYKLFILFFRAKIGWFTFFLQLCTLEILPCFILNKVLLEMNIIFK